MGFILKEFTVEGAGKTKENEAYIFYCNLKVWTFKWN